MIMQAYDHEWAQVCGEQLAQSDALPNELLFGVVGFGVVAFRSVVGFGFVAFSFVDFDVVDSVFLSFGVVSSSFVDDSQAFMPSPQV